MDRSQKVISINEQKKDILYEMELKFKLSIEMKEINNIMQSFGFVEKLGMKDIVEVTMHQIVPFVPDDEILNEYARVIQKNYLKNNIKFSCNSCEFAGYNYLYAVENNS